jgi:hypothetical protein
MALSNYTELKASVTRAIGNRGDAATAIDDWIVMFEKEMNILLHRREMSQRATASTVVGQSAYALPADFGDAIVMHLNTSDRKVPLTPSTWTRIATGFVENGEPEEWAVTANEFVLGPTPDAVYTLELYYYKQVPAIADTATSWLLTNYPRLYLYGVLVHSGTLVSDQQAGLWAAQYADALANLKKDQIRERGFGGGPILTFDGAFGGASASIFTDQ